MNHWFKLQAIRDLVKYNQWLVFICGGLVLITLLLSIKVMSSTEHWVLIPATATDKRLEFSSKGYSRAYLKEWAMYVMHTLMTTSADTVEAEVEELKVVSSKSEKLKDFFNKHIEFVKGSNVESVFFPKRVNFIDNAVIVSGHFRYWLGSSEKVISQQKTYKLTYKQGPKGVLLLKGVLEHKL